MEVKKKINRGIILIIFIIVGISVLVGSFIFYNINNTIWSLDIDKSILYQKVNPIEGIEKAVFPKSVKGLNKNKKEITINNIKWDLVKKENNSDKTIYIYKPIIAKEYKLKNSINIPNIRITIESILVEIEPIEDIEVTYYEKINKTILFDKVYNGKIELQLYKEDKWITTKEFISNSDKLKIDFSNEYIESVNSKWRIKIPKSDNYKEFISNEFNVNIKKVETSVSGIEKSISSPKNLDIKRNVKVINALGKDLILQVKNSKTNKWEDKKSFKTNNKDDLVTIDFPNWSEFDNSVWRLFIKDDFRSSSFVSDDIKIKTIDTKLKNVPKTLEIQENEDATFKVTFDVALGRSILLQKLSDNEWKTVKEFKSNDKITDEVSITIPYEKENNSYWRLYVNKSNYGSEFVSNKISVLVRNKTIVKGINTNYQKKVGQKIENVIKVSPALGRTVYLDYFNEEKNKWENKNKYVTENKDNANVNIVYPDIWEKKINTKWRIRIPDDNNASGYTKIINIKAKPKYEIPNGYLQIEDNIHFSGGGYNLVKGTMGLKVRKVQLKLNIKSERAIVDNEMIKKVKYFQQKNGLNADGIVGLSTWKKMGFSEYDWYNLGTYVTPKKTNMYSSKEDYIEAMISTAYSYLGTDYVIGASGKPKSGIDCSGLVMQGMYAAGINPLPVSVVRHSQPGYEYESYFLWNHPKLKHVKYSERKRGDLIFYKNDIGNLSHVAIYLGNDQVIESYPPKVVIWPIKNSERSNIMGVVRVFP